MSGALPTTVIVARYAASTTWSRRAGRSADCTNDAPTTPRTATIPPATYAVVNELGDEPPPWTVESTSMPATTPIWVTITCAALATPRLAVSTALAAELINDGCDAPSPSPDRISAPNTSASVSVEAPSAKHAIDTTTSAHPRTLARRSPTRTAT